MEKAAYYPYHYKTIYCKDKRYQNSNKKQKKKKKSKKGKECLKQHVVLDESQSLALIAHLTLLVDTNLENKIYPTFLFREEEMSLIKPHFREWNVVFPGCQI